MRTRSRIIRGVAALAATGLVATLAAACGSGSAASPSKLSGSQASKEFPESQFPRSTFGGLSGKVVYYDTSGGLIADSLSKSVWADFTRLTGVPVTNDYNEGAAKLIATLQSGSKPPWSMMEVGSATTLKQLEKLGYLEPLDPKVVPMDLLGPNSGADKYAIPSEQFGAVLVYNTKKWPTSGQHPTTWADLFDTKKFPGKRCLYKGVDAGGTLEAALLADGVPADSLYPLDVPRALAKLKSIAKDTVWWSSGSESIQNLASGECALGITWTGRVYDGAVKQKLPLASSWQQPIVMSGYWAVPKNAPNAKAGQALIGMWLRDTKGLIKYVSATTQTTPVTSLPLNAYPSGLRAWIPAGDNIKNAVVPDADYWAANMSKVQEQFTSFLTN